MLRTGGIEHVVRLFPEHSQSIRCRKSKRKPARALTSGRAGVRMRSATLMKDRHCRSRVEFRGAGSLLGLVGGGGSQLGRRLRRIVRRGSGGSTGRLRGAARIALRAATHRLQTRQQPGHRQAFLRTATIAGQSLVAGNGQDQTGKHDQQAQSLHGVQISAWNLEPGHTLDHCPAMLIVPAPSARGRARSDRAIGKLKMDNL